MGTYTPPPSPVYSDGAGGAEANGALTAQANQSALGGLQLLKAGSSALSVLGMSAGGVLQIDQGGNFGVELVGTNFYVNSSGYMRSAAIFQLYNGTTTALQGMPWFPAGTAPTHETNSAPASTTFASPPAGMYRIFVSLDVKTATTLSATMKVTYTDSEGTAQSDVLVFLKEGSVTLLSAVVAADRYVAEHCICTNGATNIVIADNSGTYTTCDYYYGVALERLA